MEIQLTKCHGSGNDFLIIDEITHEYAFSESDRVELARILCDRNTEIGADGILFIMKSDHADGRMRVFNSDGSEASMCGNGLRCAGRYVCELLGKKEALIETMKADLPVKEQPEISPEVTTYQVEISPVSFQLTDLPLQLDQETLQDEKIPDLSEELKFTALAVPNPHLVAIVDSSDLESNIQEELSRRVNSPNKWFPDGVNVSFLKLLTPGNIYVRTFERGVGFTNACGTAMSASTLVSCLAGLNKIGEVVNVYNNGGKVQCVVHKSNELYKIDLIGNATYVYSTAVTIDFSRKSFEMEPKQFFKEETSYAKLQEEADLFLTKHK
ncbi:MAG: diaminopimelate epimerase [Bacillota bacterium]|nr:diaminopimelate epimerase [Bacillota bacterium]